MLTPNAVNKVVAFEMICWANGVLPYFFIFKFFFRFSATVTSTRSLLNVEVISWFLMARLRKTSKTNGYGLTRIESVASVTRKTISITLLPNCFLITRLLLIF